ncbi:hypothetical protein DFH28DRAFT_432672 [Melampsora americana]|nr:hypothetical protein DFH28DRAFT_432672 [Melampsora americana]
MYTSATFCSILFTLYLTQAQQIPSLQPRQLAQGAQQLTLNPTLVNPASLTTGNEGGGKPSTPSAQSPNNFINFCEGQTLTNGLMNEQGSCSPIPLGSIPSKDRMPSVRFVAPVNFQRVEANQPIEVRMSVRNLIAGSVSNPANTYYSAPQQLGPNGFIIGHIHMIADKIQPGVQQAPDISQKPAFFKPVDAQADANGIITFVMDPLPDGEYRLTTITSSTNHAPVIVPNRIAWICR